MKNFWSWSRNSHRKPRSQRRTPRRSQCVGQDQILQETIWPLLERSKKVKENTDKGEVEVIEVVEADEYWTVYSPVTPYPDIDGPAHDERRIPFAAMTSSWTKEKCIRDYRHSISFPSLQYLLTWYRRIWRTLPRLPITRDPNHLDTRNPLSTQ